jgi:hypothetical protein
VAVRPVLSLACHRVALTLFRSMKRPERDSVTLKPPPTFWAIVIVPWLRSVTFVSVPLAF